MYTFFIRSNDASFARGVLAKQSYIRRKDTRMVSLQMCFMGWLFELIAIVFACLAPLLHHFEIPNLQMIDCTMMFVLIPFFHLLNDEKTNGIISDENWYQGMRHLLGIYIPPEKLEGTTAPDPIPKQNRNPSPSRTTNLASAQCNLTPNSHMFIKRNFSTPILLPSNKESPIETACIPKRHHSLPKCNIIKQSILIENPSTLPTSISSNIQ